MNKVVLIGRLTADPKVRSATVANYTLAVDRKFKREGQPDADFINCVAFGKQAEFAAKYLHKGMKIGVCGRIQTGSYTAQDSSTRHTTDVVAEEHYFMESKAQESAQSVTDATTASGSASVRVTTAYNDDFRDAVQTELPFD